MFESLVHSDSSPQLMWKRTVYLTLAFSTCTLLCSGCKTTSINSEAMSQGSPFLARVLVVVE